MTDYAVLEAQAEALAKEEPFWVPLMANVSALLYEAMEDVNWAGFYVMRDGGLVLGPFQGKPACIHIAPGRGVCGTAAAKDTPQLVRDVHLFPGHIACDAASRSEVVIPIHKEGRVAAVLDIDSPRQTRFTEEDLAGLQGIVRILEERICMGP